MASSSTASGIGINTSYEGTTNNNNKEVMNSTSNNNEISEVSVGPSYPTQHHFPLGATQLPAQQLNYQLVGPQGSVPENFAYTMPIAPESQATIYPQAFQTMTPQDSYWNIDVGASSHLADNTNTDQVTLFMAYNGEWKHDGKEWVFMNCRGLAMAVPMRITLSEITDMIHNRFFSDKELYRLKLEVKYKTGYNWFPVTEINNDQDLSVFISETSKTKLPLCVTWLENKPREAMQDKRRDDVDEERRKDHRAENRLMKAIGKDWGKAREIVNTTEVTWTSKLDEFGNTALHFAVGRYKDNEVLKDIIRGINSELLVTAVKNSGDIPAHTAAYFGNIEALKMMLDSNPECLFVHNNNRQFPIHLSLIIAGVTTFIYLFKQMKRDENNYGKFLRDPAGFELLRQVIDTGFIDVAYEIINDYPRLAISEYGGGITALHCIISKPELFYSGTHYSLCQKFVYHLVPIKNISFGGTDTADVENQETPKHTRRCLHNVISRIWVKLWEKTLLHVPHIKHLKDDKVKHNTTIKLLRRICEETDRKHASSDIGRLYGTSICLAVEYNIAEAIDVLTTYFATLFYSSKDGYSTYQLTVLNRSEKVYKHILCHEPDARFDFSVPVDGHGNNILHLVGRLAPIHKLNSASGAALQMQRELQWFEEVKKVVQPKQIRNVNRNNETPMMVFRREHEKLRKDGEEWMKKTADSYTITAALIITIVFAAAITVPGGNDSATGKPIYETNPSLIIFAISDAISLFTSTTSLLLFLSILTARYADEDFLYKLPKRLIYGLVMLFVSVTSMMIAFSATLYIMFGQEKQWILIPIGALACLPIASFVTLQFPLLVELISSTFGHGMFGKEKDYRKSSANANKKKRT